MKVLVEMFLGFHNVISVNAGEEQHKKHCQKHKVVRGQFVTGAGDLLTFWLSLQRSLDDWLGKLYVSETLRN